MTSIAGLTVSENLCIEWPGGETSSFSYLWLRDNARDEASFDARSHQRRVFTAEIDWELRPDSARLVDGDLLIKWPDTDAEITYPASFLHQYRTSDTMDSVKIETWDGSLSAPRVSFRSLGSDNTLLEALRTYGFAVVHDCPTEQSSIERIVSQLGYVRQTIFGGVWSFEADAAMDDSAYSAEVLRPHTDGTYSYDPPGVQILLCLEKEGQGGESILVDGFHVAERVRAEAPEVFDDLCRIPIAGIYKGDGEVLRARHPVFTVEDGAMRQVCFNNYDRDVMWLPPDEMERMYRGIRIVDGKFNEEANQWRYTLSAGEAIVFDNWRVLHGRTEYTGKRRMTGSYVNREDLESRFLTRIDNV